MDRPGLYREDLEVVRPKGTIVTFGQASGPVSPFAPLKLSPKALKLARPNLGPFIAEPEDFARYATEILDIISKGGLKVSCWPPPEGALNDTSSATKVDFSQFEIYKVYCFTVEGVA
jgi:NADPH:quinone reductase-like Zn-dependent oxidoreductase